MQDCRTAELQDTGGGERAETARPVCPVVSRGGGEELREQLSPVQTGRQRTSPHYSEQDHDIIETQLSHHDGEVSRPLGPPGPGPRHRHGEEEAGERGQAETRDPTVPAAHRDGGDREEICQRSRAGWTDFHRQV